jgi:hypothetical protein
LEKRFPEDAFVKFTCAQHSVAESIGNRSAEYSAINEHEWEEIVAPRASIVTKGVCVHR